eukprot:TRINITY_DN1319_c0_g1_i4.p1 TRINITY_DN1319_c0_g1~~TRINITY_DN1319_c0_g1_i4.p1  ORF type:complete len:266 (+),score=112.03 TRINITY_DN1319_c0_g1_i4:379-1176(+)
MPPAVPQVHEDMEFEDFSHKTEKLFGRRLSVVSFEEKRWLIGVQLATLLQRETFNMYRSMKIKNIGIQRASSDQVTNLVRLGVIPNGTHSVTFVPYEDGLYFVADIKSKQHLVLDGGYTIKVKASRSFVQTKPKIHRRKPAPWEVFRSIRQDIIELKPTRHSSTLLSLSSPDQAGLGLGLRSSSSDLSSPYYQHHYGSSSTTPSSSCPASPDPHYEYNEPGPTTRSLRSAASRAAAAAAAAAAASSSSSADFYDSISLMMSQSVA